MVREKDVNYRLEKLENETLMREEIMAETYSTLRDSEVRGRCVTTTFRSGEYCPSLSGGVAESHVDW